MKKSNPKYRKLFWKTFWLLKLKELGWIIGIPTALFLVWIILIDGPAYIMFKYNHPTTISCQSNTVIVPIKEKDYLKLIDNYIVYKKNGSFVFFSDEPELINNYIDSLVKVGVIKQQKDYYKTLNCALQWINKNFREQTNVFLTTNRIEYSQSMEMDEGILTSTTYREHYREYVVIRLLIVIPCLAIIFYWLYWNFKKTQKIMRKKHD